MGVPDFIKSFGNETIVIRNTKKNRKEKRRRRKNEKTCCQGKKDRCSRMVPRADDGVTRVVQTGPCEKAG